MNIAIIGYGKMGKAIENIAVQRGHQIGLKINRSNIYEFSTANLQKCDVAIEFTNPENAVQNIIKCFEAKLPVISGSTGWLKDWELVKTKCNEEKTGLLYASNFSIGVNIFFELNLKLAQLMKPYNEYNVIIEETHHTQKKDAPSGTAITLAEQILNNNLIKKTWVNEPATSSSQLSIISKREDPVPGTHCIKYRSTVDDIEIIHTAHNRSGFALGAVLAAEFIQFKKGIYTMKDVLF